jgi:hypothetical protein
MGEGIGLGSCLVAGNSTVSGDEPGRVFSRNLRSFQAGFGRAAFCASRPPRNQSPGVEASEVESGSGSTTCSGPITLVAHSRTATTVSSALVRSSGGASKGSA